MIESTCEHITGLRAHVGGLEARMAHAAGGVVALHRKRRNLVDLGDRFTALAAVNEMVRIAHTQKETQQTPENSGNQEVQRPKRSRETQEVQKLKNPRGPETQRPKGSRNSRHPRDQETQKPRP